MKKYFIFAAAAIVALAACTKSEINTPAQKEISYNAVTGKNTVSKAIIDHSYYGPDDPTFGIWGLYQAASWSESHGSSAWVGSSTTSAQIAYKDVAYDHDNDENETIREWRNNNGIDYWPVTGSLVFMGYSPYTNVSEKARISVANNNVVLTVTNFASSTGNYVDDLMWSDAVEASSNTTAYSATGMDATYNGVPVVFHHALSMITVKAKTAIDYAAQGYTFTITGITLHIDDGATLTVTDPVAANTTPTVEWGEPATDAAPSILTGGTTALTTTYVQQGSSVLVIPQDLATKRATLDDKLSVTYQVVHNGVTSTVSKDILLTAGADANITSLAANTKYNLNLLFTLEEILYSPSVVDWESTQQTSEYDVPGDAVQS